MKNKIKFLIPILVIIPLISIFIIIQVRHTYLLSNDDIIKYVIEADKYSSKAKFIIKNSVRQYEEDTQIYYDKDLVMRIEFGEQRVKVYKDDHISMTDNGEQYEINEDFDTVYPLAFCGSLLENEINYIKEGKEEWGEIEYLEVSVDLPSKNKHINQASIYIDKVKKTPIIAKIYDQNGIEKIVIVYDDFKYLKEIDDCLFTINPNNKKIAISNK